MNVRLLLKKPTKADIRDKLLEGILYYKDGVPVGYIEIQTRRNKTSMWETVEVSDGE